MINGRCWHLTPPGQACATTCGTRPEIYRLPAALYARARAQEPPVFQIADEVGTVSGASTLEVVQGLSRGLPTDSCNEGSSSESHCIFWPATESDCSAT